MNRVLSLLIVPAICIALGSTQCQAEDLKITGMYSSLEFNEEGGDLLGMEMYLVYGGGDAYFALVQCAEGAPTAPLLVPVKVSGSKVSFNLTGSPECGTSFTGVVSKDGLRGRFAGQEEDRWLPRKRGYWE